MKTFTEYIKEKPWFGWVLFLITVIIVFFLGMLASSIVERRAEAIFAYTPVIDFPEWEPRNEVWGKFFPRQYQSYLRTSDTLFRSRYNGSAMIDMLKDDPRLVILWAGYPFSKDYSQGRGHYYAVTDIRKTLRIGAPDEGKPSPLPNTCWTCKSPDVPRLMSEIGISEFYKGSLDTKGSEVLNHIGCADCHDAKTMNLRISRPALIEAYERMGKDISKSSHQEMRSLVCAQCHVEYYFDKNRFENVQYLTFPWDNGMSADDMEKYYDKIGFSDWTHALSKTPMLKSQHPDYEIFTTGVHFERGISCADCHMPYKSEGGQKFTDHHIQSPLNNVANSCQVCHREETASLIQDVYARQERIIHNRDKLEEILVRAHVEAKYAWEFGAQENQMQEILQLIRHAQWRWDFAASSHGGSFHSPVETSRIIGAGIAKAGEARIKLTRLLASLGHFEEIPYPDISSKSKAQAFIGLDMVSLEAEKQQFINNVLPKWIEEGRQRESKWNKEK